MTQQVKNPPAIEETQEVWVRSLGQEDPLEEEMAAHSSVLAWKSHRDRGAWWTRQSLWGPKESDMTEQLNNSNLITSVKTPFFQTRSHSQVPGVRISTRVSGGHNSAPNTLSSR